MKKVTIFSFLIATFTLIPILGEVSAQNIGTTNLVPTEVRSVSPISPNPINTQIGARVDTRVDLNGDGVIGYADLRIMLNSDWGQCRFTNLGDTSVSVLRADRCRGDFNQDTFVNNTDVAILLNAWTEGGVEGKASISAIQEKCQAVDDTDLRSLQRRCFLAAAQEAETNAKQSRIVPTLKARTEARTDAFSANDAGTVSQERNIETHVKRYLNYMSNMITRMTAAIERLNDLALRIESRIAKIEAGNTNAAETEEANRLLEEARDQISKARTALQELSGAYETVFAKDSASPISEFERIREMVQNVRESITGAHKALVQVIVTLRAGN